jgi:hypothetical protein
VLKPQKLKKPIGWIAWVRKSTTLGVDAFLFSRSEIEALVLCARMVRAWGGAE